MKLAIATLSLFISLLVGEETPSQECSVVEMQEFYQFAAQKVKVTTPNEWKVGENEIIYELEHKEMPSGYLIAGFADIYSFDGDTPPKIVDGYPKTTITILEPGEYEFEIKLNLIYKAS